MSKIIIKKLFNLKIMLYQIIKSKQKKKLITWKNIFKKTSIHTQTKMIVNKKKNSKKAQI